ncbi:MAG: hypothetical protein ACI3Y8_04170 [Candidatus Cryptobacteroides sp.]
MDIDLLAKMIRDVVLEKDEVALPGLGVFVAEFVPASFSDKGFTINPPYKRLSFRQEDNAGDDTLVRMYAEANNIGEDAAARIVNDFLAGLKDILMVRKAVVFPELGKLRATRENNFFFIADENLDIYPEGFGLEQVSLKTHQEAVSEVAETMAGLRSILEPDTASGTDIAPESETPPAPETAPESESVPASETVLEADSAPESENAAGPEVEPVVVAAAASGVALQSLSEDEPDIEFEIVPESSSEAVQEPACDTGNADGDSGAEEVRVDGQVEEGMSGDDAEGESFVETGSETAEQAAEEAEEQVAEQAADGCAEGDAEQSGTNAEDTMEIAEETAEESAEESAAETESEPAEETAAAEEESAEEPAEDPAAEAASATSEPEKDNDFGIIPPLDIQIEETDSDAEDAPLADADLDVHSGQDSETVGHEVLSEILVIEDNGKAIEDNANEPSRSSRFWKTFRIIAVTLAVLAILALAAFIILSRVAPDFIDRILYSPEELDIVRQMTSVR